MSKALVHLGLGAPGCAPAPAVAVLCSFSCMNTANMKSLSTWSLLSTATA